MSKCAGDTERVSDLRLERRPREGAGPRDLGLQHQIPDCPRSRPAEEAHGLRPLKGGEEAIL